MAREAPNLVRTSSPQAVGVALTLLATVVFGTTPAVLTSLRGELSIPQLVTFRALFAAALFGSLALACGRTAARPSSLVADPRHGLGSAPRRPRLWRRYPGVALGTCFVAPDALIFYTSFDYIDTSVAVALGFVYPLIVIAITAALARRLPARRDFVLSGLALVGVVLVVGPGGSAEVRPLGALLVCASATIYATYVVVAGGLTKTIGPLVLGAQVMVGVFVTGLAVTLLTGGPVLPADARAWAVVVVNGALLVVAFAAYYGGLRRLGATRASLIDTAQPLAAAAAGVVVLHERLSAWQVIGVLVIIASVALNSLGPGREHDPAVVEPR